MNIFEKVYEEKLWGDNKDTDYLGSSGDGSSVEYNEKYIDFLKSFIQNNNIKSVVDLGCGDFRCGPLIYENYEGSFIGYDIYEKMIEKNKVLYEKQKFITLDFCNHVDEIEDAQLYILKDVVQHWPTYIIKEFIDKIVQKRKFTYLLVTNCFSESTYNITNIGEFRPISNELNNWYPETVLEYNTKKTQLISRFIYQRDFKVPNDLSNVMSKLKIIGLLEPTFEDVEVLKNYEAVSLGKVGSLKKKGNVILGTNNHYFVTENLNKDFICYDISKYPFTKIAIKLTH